MNTGDSDWLFQRSGLRSQEWASDRQLRHAVDQARNRDTISRGERQLLLPDAGRYLSAVNRFGRLLWAQALCREFSDYFDLGPDRRYPNRRLYLGTLTDLACSTSPEAKFVDIPRFKHQLREGLSGLSYLGMFEPAFYTNIVRTASFPMERAVSWHPHLICWGESQEAIEERFDAMNRMSSNYRPIVPGLDGADVKRIRKMGLPGVFRYFLKSPTNSYRVFQSKYVKPDGKLIARFQQRKPSLRPGERVTLFHLLKDLYLDQLAMAGGEGVEILRRAKRRALRDIPD